MNYSDVLLIAHRGAAYDAPENTLASVELAWQRKAEAVEIDVQLSKDGHIVVIHDTNTKKLAGRNRLVRNQTLAQLKQLDFGRHKGTKWIGEQIPTFEEVLETVPKGKSLVVEIKCGLEILPKLREIIKKSNLKPTQMPFIGFGIKTMTELKKCLPEYPFFFLYDIKKNAKMKWTPSVKKMVSAAKRAGVDGLDVSACEAVDKQFVKQVKGAGLKLYVYTVNEPREAKRLIFAGVDGITTDRPRWIREKL